MDLDEAIAVYAALLPALLELEDRTKQVLREIATSHIGVYQMTSRVKEIDAFGAKVFHKGEAYQPDPVERMRDKVGIRIEVLHLDDLPRMCTALEQAAGAGLQILKREDKAAELGVTGLGYEGTHFDLLPSELLDEGLDARYAVVELQVRTMAQGVWAQADHELGYKSPLELDDYLKRRLARMTVLMETFDEEVGQVRKQIVEDERYPVARLIETLNDLRTEFRRGRVGQGNLTQEFVTLLLGDLNPLEVEASIKDWVGQEKDRIATVLEQYKTGNRNLFVDRPEGLLAFYLLDNHKFKVRQNWIDAGMWDFDALQRLALAWGDPLPEPN